MTIPFLCCQVVCKDSDTECMLVTRRNRTQAECVVSKPTTCEELECNEGMVCEMRRRLKDGKEVPRCKPENPDAARAEDCSQLTCQEGLVCEVLRSGQAKCMTIPPPTDCAELDCGEGMVCTDVGNKGRVKCVQELRRTPVVATDSGDERPPTSNTPPTTPRRPLIERGCNTLDCEDGFRCLMTANRRRNGDRRLRPTCVPTQCSLKRRPRPPRRCEEVECGSDRECVVCREGGETRARCHRPSNTDQDGHPTGIPDEDRDKPTGRPDIEKPRGTVEEGKEKPMALVIFEEDGEDTAEEDKELEKSVEADEVKPTGTPEEKSTALKEEKATGGTDKDTSEEDMENRRGRRPPARCDEVECGEDEMCFEFEHDGRRLARCVSAGQSPLLLPSLPPPNIKLVHSTVQIPLRTVKMLTAMRREKSVSS